MPDDALDTIVAAAVAQDRDAVKEILRVIRPLVVRYCRTRLGGHERDGASADDVAREVCLAVLRALPGYREQGRPFLAFVYGIAGHQVVAARRSAGHDGPRAGGHVWEPEHTERLAAALGSDRSTTDAVNAQLEELTPRQREVLRLRVVVGLSAEETARAVGSSPGAVRVAQHRALTRLRDAIDHERRNWRDAPVTGFVDLDELLHAADANLRRLVPPDEQADGSIYRRTPAVSRKRGEQISPR